MSMHMYFVRLTPDSTKKNPFFGKGPNFEWVTKWTLENPNFYFVVKCVKLYMNFYPQYLQATAVRARAASLCAEIGPHSLAICDAFAITDSMLSAPIARDWVDYNEYDNQGEVKE